ncbi:MAG: 3'-5' exonuclease [Candidatus Yanofskybacteria bacterium]|nr:3'-5' exonuclease [Candidatus Yanofskybacteria bacterium]
MIKHILNRRPKKFVADTGIKRRPLIFVDSEFSGLNLNNEVIEIGCLVVDPKTLKIKKEWFAKIKPENIKAAETSSLEIIGYSKDEWKDAISLRDGMLNFNKIAKDGVLVGYNVAWDFMFLEKSFFELGIKPAFHWQILDVLSMVFYKFYNKLGVKGFRMKEVEKFLNIKHGVWHNPLDDARATYEIFLKILK